MSSIIEKLKKMQDEHKGVDDVIKTLFYHHRNGTMKKDSSLLHKRIFILSKNPAYKDLLKGLIFDESGLTPFSNELDQILFRLELSGKLCAVNPIYEEYTIRKELLESSTKKFTAEEKALIKKMSDEFYQIHE